LNIRSKELIRKYKTIGVGGSQQILSREDLILKKDALESEEQHTNFNDNVKINELTEVTTLSYAVICQRLFDVFRKG